MAKMPTSSNDELYDLFAALDNVSASDSLKAATLERIAQLADEAEVVEGAEGVDGAQNGSKDAQVATNVQDAGETADEVAPQASDQPAFKATAGGKAVSAKARVKAKWRAVRVAAVAACLAMALTGGVAYATPTSFVTLAQDGATIELGVNWFGIAVSASSDDEAGMRAIEAADLRNVPYEEALSRAYESLESINPDKPVELSVRSDDAGQRGRLEAENVEFLAGHAPAAEVAPVPAEPSAGQLQDGGAQPEGGVSAGGGQPQGVDVDTGAPGQAVGGESSQQPAQPEGGEQPAQPAGNQGGQPQPGT